MENEQRKLIESYVEAYNDFNVAGMTENLHENVVFENISNGEVTLRTEGLSAFTEQAKGAKAYFSSRKQQIHSWNFENDLVHTSIGYEAVLAMDLPNGMKKGDLLELKGESEFEFFENKIIRITDRS